MCGAVGIVVGVLSAGLGFMQHQQNVAAQNAAIETQNQNQRAQFAVAQLQTDIRNKEEDQKQQMQDLQIDTTDFLADRGLEQDWAAINTRWFEEEEAKSFKKQESSIEALESSGKILASGKTGNSFINLINDVVRKQNKFDFNQDRGFAFVGRGLSMDKKRALIASASTKAGQQRYQKRTWIDPARPIDAPKVKSNTGLALLSAGLQGFSAGTSAAGGWAKYQHYKSSILLKENLVKVRETASGLGVYLFNYIGDSKRYMGAIAEEVLKIKPEAVARVDGYLAVNYDLIDVDFKEISSLAT
tara:strand:- start:4080 stop:4982 length:903 start_codon:yes stop_codon:yes gene_type:complete